MTTLLCFGLGYSAQRYVASCATNYDCVIGTSRSFKLPADSTATARASRVRHIEFDGSAVSGELVKALDRADRILVSIPPCTRGDPVLAACGEKLACLPRLQSIVYLSSISVYGDHGGGEVDEETAASPRSDRSRVRLTAEGAWQDLGARIGRPVAILRLAGIYGPGRNPLVKLAQGRAMRIVKPKQVFNRIHVDDVAQAIDATFARGANGIFNVADDEPCSPEQVILYGAELMGVEPPPAISLSDAAPLMEPMALSFYAENKRVRNDKLKRELGVRLIYPTYRHGLRSQHSG
jgi:NAD dependent epimerase/dehydratase family